MITPGGNATPWQNFPNACSVSPTAAARSQNPVSSVPAGNHNTKCKPPCSPLTDLRAGVCHDHPAATVALPGEWLAIVLPMVVIMVSVGMVIPACQLAVLQPYGAIAGTASGLFFFTQMFLTAVSSWATGLLSDGTSGPLAIMTSVATLLLVASWLTLHKPNVGAGLLAKAECQSTHPVADTLPSRASPLPHIEPSPAQV